MKKIFDWLKNAWNHFKAYSADEEPKEQEQQETVKPVDDLQEEVPHQELASITFILLENGYCDIDCHWHPAQSNALANAYAELLFKVNNGEFKSDVAQSLIQHALEDSESFKFLELVLMRWESLIQQKIKSPIIKPTHALKIDNMVMQK